MPSYFYHLTFELYPTPNPTERGAHVTSATSDLWLPPPGANLFDRLPSHPPREGTASSSSTKSQNTHTSATQKRPAGDKNTSSVIDCGASRRPPRDTRGNVERSPPRKWSARSPSPPPSSAAICPQTAVRDWRFGRVNIESIDFEDGGDTDMAGEDDNPNAAAFAALELGPTLGGDGSSTKAECVSLPTKNTEVGWGVVHFYRGEEMPPPGLAPESEADGEDGVDEEFTTLCIPAVPSFILPSEFLGFVGEKWRGDVTHFRMVMTSRMSRYLVLLKFRDSRKAKEWQKEFNGKVFNSMVVSTCPRLLFVLRALIDATRPRSAT